MRAAAPEMRADMSHFKFPGNRQLSRNVPPRVIGSFDTKLALFEHISSYIFISDLATIEFVPSERDI